MRMGDGEFGLRAYLNGLKSISNPFAKRLHLKVNVGGLRQMGSWDAFRSRKLFAPKPIPSVTYLMRKYFSKSEVREFLILGIASSLKPYKLKSKKFFTFLSMLGVLFLSPLIFIQLYNSWKKASAMLNEGDKIEKL
jgi:hypothetical protein